VLVVIFLGPQNSNEKWQADDYFFSKEFCENPGNLPNNRKKGNKIQKEIFPALPVFKRFLLIQSI
jgi:hypothetical protein